MNAFRRGQDLADAANATAAMHVLYSQGEFRHNGLLLFFDDSPAAKMQIEEAQLRNPPLPVL
jgi:hypothetical protein